MTLVDGVMNSIWTGEPSADNSSPYKEMVPIGTR